MRTRTRMAAAACGMLLSTAALSANDPVLEWNSIMVSTTAGQNPFFQARFAAITQLAVFEAVNAIDKDFDPYLGTVVAPPTASSGSRRSRGGPCGAEELLPGQRIRAGCRARPHRSPASRWDREAGRNRSGRGRRGRDDRAAHRRRLRAAGVLLARIGGPGRMAADAELSAGGRHPAAVAESASVRDRDHRSVPRRAAAGAQEQALCARLQRSEARRRRR